MPHTAAPWMAVWKDGWIWINRKDCPSRLPIAVIPYNADGYRETAWADATLIAAAPRLLHALRGLVEFDNQPETRGAQILAVCNGWGDGVTEERSNQLHAYWHEARAALAQVDGVVAR